MFGTDWIDVAIGLFVVYLLFSLLCTSLNECVLGYLTRARANLLAEGIRRLLSDRAIADAFFDHPFIAGLARPRRFGSKAPVPSYIPAHTFAQALMAVLEAKAPKQGDASPTPTHDGSSASNAFDRFRKALATSQAGVTADLVRRLVEDATDLAEVRQRLEQWFNDSMDRVTGWYKRRAQLWTVAWAVICVGLLNLDTLELADTLAHNSRLRAALVAAAPAALETARQPPAPKVEDTRNAPNTDRLEAIESRLDALSLPLGWGQPVKNWTLKLLGLLLSVGALSLGAPFWFDLLNKAVNLRATGPLPRPASSKSGPRAKTE